MADPAPTVINRRIWAWSSIEFSMLGTGVDGRPLPEEIVTPIRSIDYDDGSSPTIVMAAGYYPHGIADGQYTPGSMTLVLLAQYAREFMSRVTNNGAVELSSVDLRLVLKMRARHQQTVLRDDIDFRLIAPSDSRAQGGGDPLETSFACLPTLIRRNGVVI